MAAGTSRRFRPYIVGDMGWDVVYTATADVPLQWPRFSIASRCSCTSAMRRPGTPIRPRARYNGMLAALDARYFSMWCGYWQALEAARGAGASAADETRLRDELFVWRPSPVEAARQLGTSGESPVASAASPARLDRPGRLTQVRLAMNILLAGDYPPDATLGSTKVIVKLQEEFRALGHRCDVLLADGLVGAPRNPYLRQAFAPIAALRAVQRLSATTRTV